MNINEAIAILSDPTKDVLIIDNAELVGWLKELQEAKQYLGELLTNELIKGDDIKHGQTETSVY